MKPVPIDVLIELHAETIETHGGMPGIRDRGAIEASYGRVQHLLDYADPPPDSIDIACGLCVSLCRNHGFIDGNKRAAFIALGVTLELNGWVLDAREQDAARTVLALAAGALTETPLNAWVRANAVRESD
jgi:death-on-curing protein